MSEDDDQAVEAILRMVESDRDAAYNAFESPKTRKLLLAACRKAPWFAACLFSDASHEQKKIGRRKTALRLLRRLLEEGRRSAWVAELFSTTGIETSAISVAALDALGHAEPGSDDECDMRVLALGIVAATGLRDGCALDVSLARRWCTVVALSLSEDDGVSEACRALQALFDSGPNVTASCIESSLTAQPADYDGATAVHWDEALCAAVAGGNDEALEVLVRVSGQLGRSRALGLAIAKRVLPLFLEREVDCGSLEAVLDVGYPKHIITDAKLARGLVDLLERCRRSSSSDNERYEAFLRCWASFHRMLRSQPRHWPKWARAHGAILAVPYNRQQRKACPALIGLITDAATASTEEPKAFLRVWQEGGAFKAFERGFSDECTRAQLQSLLDALTTHVLPQLTAPLRPESVCAAVVGLLLHEHGLEMSDSLASLLLRQHSSVLISLKARSEEEKAQQVAMGLAKRALDSSLALALALALLGAERTDELFPEIERRLEENRETEVHACLSLLTVDLHRIFQSDSSDDDDEDCVGKLAEAAMLLLLRNKSTVLQERSSELLIAALACTAKTPRRLAIASAVEGSSECNSKVRAAVASRRRRELMSLSPPTKKPPTPVREVVYSPSKATTPRKPTSNISGIRSTLFTSSPASSKKKSSSSSSSAKKRRRLPEDEAINAARATLAELPPEDSQSQPSQKPVKRASMATTYTTLDGDSQTFSQL